MQPFVVIDPCHEPWDAMRETAGARHCAHCEKHVVDLARMTEAQIRGLLVLTGGSMCARQTVVDGALVTAPPTPTRTRFPIRIALGGALVASAACAPVHHHHPEPAPDPIVAVAPEAPAPEPQPAPAPEPAPPEPDHVLVGGITSGPDVIHLTIHFAKRSARVPRESLPALDEVAHALRDNPWIAKVRIEGHVTADELGRRAPTLALARANAVRAFLVKQGIEPARLEAIGIDAADPTRGVSFVVEQTL